MKKIYFNIAFLFLLVCSLFVVKDASASEELINCDNADWCTGSITWDDINTLIEYNNIDTSYYDTLYVAVDAKDGYYGRSSYFRIFFLSIANGAQMINSGSFIGPARYFTTSVSKTVPAFAFSTYNFEISMNTLVSGGSSASSTGDAEHRLEYYGPSTFDISVPISIKLNASNDESINSLDYYLDTDKISNSYDFEIDYTDNYDYTDSNLAYADIKSYSLTGLINNNGLYHWVEIPGNSGDTFNWYVSHYDDNCWETEDCHLYESNNVDGTGFYYKQKLNFGFDITEYEQLRFRINLTNANDYTIEYGDNYDSISVDYMDLNYSALGDHEEFYNYSRIPSNGYRYITFTTNKELMSNSIMIKTDKYSGSNPLVFIDTFNTYTYSFIDYDGFNFNVYGDNYKYFRYLFNIGTSVTKGFYLTQNYNKDEEYFDYFVYLPTDLYYSYSDYADESTFINSSGDVISGGIIPSYDVVDRPDDYTTGQFDVSIDYFSSPIRYVFVCMSRFYDGLPIEIKYTLIAVLTISASLVIIKFIL